MSTDDRPAARFDIYDVDRAIARSRRRRESAATRDVLHAVLVALIAIAMVIVQDITDWQAIVLATAFFLWAALYTALIVAGRIR